MVICLLAEAGYYLHDYFTAYAERSQGSFQGEFNALLREAFARRGSAETVYISGSALSGDVGRDFKPYLYADILFWSRLSPAVYQRRGFPAEEVCAYVGRVERPGLLLRCDALIEIDRRQATLVIHPNPEPVPPAATRLMQLALPRATLAYGAQAHGPVELRFTDPSQQAVHYELYRVTPGPPSPAAAGAGPP